MRHVGGNPILQILNHSLWKVKMWKMWKWLKASNSQISVRGKQNTAGFFATILLLKYEDKTQKNPCFMGCYLYMSRLNFGTT